jgi:hypothetical protein
MRSRFRNPAGPLGSVIKGISVGVMIFFILSLRAAPSVQALSGNHWMIGTYYKGTYTGGSLSGVSNVGANFKNNGMPAPSGTATFAVLTVSYNGTSSVPWIPQISIENINDGNYNGYFLYVILLNSQGQQYTSFNAPYGFYNNSVSGLSNSWHVLSLGTISQVLGNTNYEYLEWYLDGTAYIGWQIATCTTPCSFSSTPYYANNWIVSSMGVESYDNTNGDFSSLDVHGYFQVSGTNVGNMYLYPANYGYNHGCPLPSGAQKSTGYLSLNVQGPDNADVTGHVHDSTWGATDEWAIGEGDTSVYADIEDSELSSTLCSSGPPQLA